MPNILNLIQSKTVIYLTSHLNFKVNSTYKLENVHLIQSYPSAEIYAQLYVHTQIHMHMDTYTLTLCMHSACTLTCTHTYTHKTTANLFNTFWNSMHHQLKGGVWWANITKDVRTTMHLTTHDTSPYSSPHLAK